MPDDRDTTRRIHDEIAAITVQTRAIIARSFDVLRQAVPDTFLGRRTHDPFPSEPADRLADDR